MFGFGLTRRKGSSIWQVRKRWPADLAALLKGEFTRSTGEADRKAAEGRLPALAAEYQAKVADARRRLADNRYRDLSKVEIERLAAKFYSEALPRYRITRPLSPAQRQQLLSDTQAQLRTLVESVASNDPTAVAAIASNLVAREGLPILEDSQSLAALRLLVLRAFVELHKGVVAQLQGEVTYRPVDDSVAKLVDADGSPTRTVKDLLDAYEEDKGEAWSPSAKSAFQPVRRLLEDTLGEREAASITREDARDTLSLLRALPRNLGKLKPLRGLKVPQAVEAGRKLNLTTIAPNTINSGYLVHLAALFNWARKEQWADANPFEGLAVHDPVAPEDKRDPFNIAQLRSIFSGEPWASRRTAEPLRFWGPLLALFLGMRRGEIAQLGTADVETLDGVPIIQVRGDGEKRLKTRNARRTIPIHPELLRMGFLAFATDQRRGGHAQLFPDEKPDGRGKWGDGLSDWFTRLLKARGVSGTKLGMHSFRHNWQDRVRAGGLHGTAIAQELAGRSKRGSVSDSYGEGSFPAQMLADAVAKISYPELDLSHLHVPERAEAA